jgi:hypothetical protein
LTGCRGKRRLRDYPCMITSVPSFMQFFETFSYLPPLTNNQIAAQVDFIIANGEPGRLAGAQPPA